MSLAYLSGFTKWEGFEVLPVSVFFWLAPHFAEQNFQEKMVPLSPPISPR